MIYVDMKTFGSDEVINLMLDENMPVGQLPYLHDEKAYILSERQRSFLSKEHSFISQGVRGGDRLVLIKT